MKSLLQAYRSCWAELDAIPAFHALVLVAVDIGFHQLKAGDRAYRGTSTTVNAFGLIYAYFVHNDS
jgi:hypothetical protein